MNPDVTNNVSELVPIFCPDNSQTFFNNTFNESYHSKVGALAEAEHKFANPSKELIKQSDSRTIKILDPFFGLGYNTGAALQLAHELFSNPKIEVIAIEKDIEIVKKIKDIKVPDSYKEWKNFLSILPEKNFVELNDIKVNLIIDDIFNMVDSLSKFDLIFFDPFSYKVAPDFWSDDFLLKVFNLLLPNGRLTTYSGLKRVEKLALDNKYNIIKIPALGRKKHSLCIEAIDN